jgi:1-phosphofructokinase family hexose kinase
MSTREVSLITDVVVWNPNPTLDVVSEIDDLTAGAVHRARSQTLSAGGKGTLVVRALSRLEVRAVGIAPVAGVTGELVSRLIGEEGLPMETTAVSGATRAAVSIVEGATKRDTVINGPGPATDDALWDEHIAAVLRLLHRVKPRYFVIAGRPPLSAGATAASRLLKEATRLDIKTVLDVSSPILEALVTDEPWLVKVNADEAATALDESLGASGPALIKAMRFMGARNVVLTDGTRRIYAVVDGQSVEALPPMATTVSAVGCGDCFLAGFLHGLLQESGTIAALRIAAAVAGAAAETLQPGDFEVGRAFSLKGAVRIGTGEIADNLS